MLQAQKVFSSLFDGLAPRQRDILVNRFGLQNGEPETLAALGKRYGITRERVRQIEASAIDLLKKRIKVNNACIELIHSSVKYLRSMGGVVGQEDLLAYHRSFIEGLTANHVAFLVEATGAFCIYPADKNFLAFYYTDKQSLKKTMDWIAQFTKSLKAKKREILNGAYQAHLVNFVREKRMEQKLAESLLGISKKIMASPYGDVGLAEWPEISPRTVRDRIYLILKKKGEPIHFENIARDINEAGFGGRKALGPTVHNELIKDARFVLVGRGIYGLAEQGYEPGTAKEVIHKILKKNGPLAFKDLVKEVQKDRFFKQNTILANLQNKGLFERLTTGVYRVREA